MKRRKSFFFTHILISLAVISAFSGSFLLVLHFVEEVKEAKGESFYESPVLGDVLFISSYDPRYLITQQQFEGLDQALKREGVMYEVMYMDMLNYDTRENYELFYQTMHHKISLRKKKYQVVIVSDDAALGFVEQYQNQLFAETPVIFFGINDLAHAREAKKNPWMTGMGEQIFVDETIEIMIEQNPKISKICCLLDDSLTGNGDKEQFVEAMKKYPNLSYDFLSFGHNSKEDFTSRLSEIPADCSILCLSSLQSYAHTNAMSVYELISLVNSVTLKIPIYRTNIVGIGNGFLGGKVFDHYKVAEHVAEIAKEILEGRNINDFDDDDFVAGKVMFDYQQMKEFGISEATLPAGTVFVNKPEKFYAEIKSVIVPFALIIFSLILMVLIFAESYKRLKRINGIALAMNTRMRQINKELVDSKTRLTFVANNDGLTELPNRICGEEEIKKLMGSGIPFTLFLLDIDDFKNYNDTYTHACGDYVLCEISRRLTELTITGDYFAARHGGDEFLLVYKCGHIEKSGAQIEKLRHILNAPIDYKGNHLGVTITLGYADSQPDISFDNLITNADIAMYEAKKIGNGACLGFMPEMKESVVKRNQIIDILKDECSHGGFEIRYQPQVSTKTGEVYGYEALVRLKNYKVGPDAFIPVAESGGFITQIGRIVTEKVLQQMCTWREQGMKLKKVAINYSNGQLVDRGYVSYLKTLLEKYEIPSNLIEIEITESLFMGKKIRAKQLFDDFSDIGVGLALDDFGTGYSSLSYLTFVPAGKVKIDKSLVDNYLVEGKESFIQNIVHLVHGLGMELTVEGVEHKWQYDKLCEMNCDYIQGYLFSKPMIPEAVPNFMVAV